MNPLYVLDNITQQYGSRTVLTVPHLTIAEGEHLAIVGPSGAGKSTLLRLLAFVEKPVAGELRFRQKRVTAQWPDLAHRRMVTAVFQQPLLLRRTVADNLRYGLQLRQQVDEKRIAEVAQALGLASLLQAQAHTLSGGEKQRVALGRALAIRPQLLLLDEPTANLDPANVQLMEQIIGRFATTLIIITHNLPQAQRLSQRVAFLADGKLVESAETQTFFRAPQHPLSHAFVTGTMIY